jgi:hypothetical protein
MVALPTLTMSSWLDNRNTIMTKLFEYFLASDYSQSNTFAGTIKSLKYIIHNYTTASNIRNELIQALSELYQPYYDNVLVDIEIDESTDSSTISITIRIACTYMGVDYNLARNIVETNGHIANFDDALDQIHSF